MTAPSVKLGNVMVGDDYPPVFMAEFSTYFNQDIDLAIEYIDQAIAGGAHVIKSEVLHNVDVCLKTDLEYVYNHANGKTAENYYELVSRKVLPLSKYRTIYQHCNSLGVPFVASVYDTEGIDFLVEMGASGIKISRDSLNNYPMITYAAKTGIPIIFDAGEAYLHEVAKVIHTVKKTGNNQVIVNYHPAKNPASGKHHNLNLVRTYKETFNIPVGFACHYSGAELLYLSIGMGVNLIEKGVDNDPLRSEQDVVSALPFSELEYVIAKLHECWQALDGGTVESYENRDLSRHRCLVVKRDIAVGDELNYSNLGFAWPPLGISVDKWDLIYGRKATQALKKNELLTWSAIDLES
ncbi:MAG: N-acetylneuraminate synthase family protein [Phototrophicaceae bacterium]